MVRRSVTSSTSSSSCTIVLTAAAGVLRRVASRPTGRLTLAALLLGALFVCLRWRSTHSGASPAPSANAGGWAELGRRFVGTARVIQAVVLGEHGDDAASNIAAGAAGSVPAVGAPVVAAGAPGLVPVDPSDQVEAERFFLLDTDKEQFVYSAHFDDRTSVVHIVGFKHRFKSSATRPLWCRYNRGGGDDVPLHRMEVHFNVSVFYPKPGLMYNTFVWRCAVNRGARPLSVELVSGDGTPPVATLRVQYTALPKSPEALPQFGVCVKPMVNYSNLHQLLEFVEVHRLFGVSKFIIYDHSHSSVIDEALRYYVAKGLVVLHRWPLPVPLEAVHDFGQKSMNHHCLMTYMNAFKYIAFIDIDEILVPIAPARTWSDIIAAAASSAGSKPTDGAYVFLSSVFPRAAVNYNGLDCNSRKQECKMATLVNRIRSGFYPVGSWSKPLVETRKTDLVDIHVVRQMKQGYTYLVVNSGVAFIHHYRSVPWTIEGVADNGTEPFTKDIIQAVGAMFEKFSPITNNVA